MKIKAMCPASCGELLQGEIGDGEKLISYPIDRYSVVVLEETKKRRNMYRKKKAIQAIYKTLDYFQEPHIIGDHIGVHITSRIPVAKGMASSTADIAATAVATAALLGKTLSEDTLAQICADIEPTDSTIFKEWTLFDHLKGVRIKSFEWNPKLDVLVLEGRDRLNTVNFRKHDFKALRMKNKSKVEEAYKVFQQSFTKKDYALLGKAATMSSLANQNILPKRHLEDIIESAVKVGCYGVNVAHSGTVIGILFDPKKVDKEELYFVLKQNLVHHVYCNIYATQMVQGGVKILFKK
ncbi:hypothetical protein QBE52_11740 [Clostridiaceae bacterium 35-E11]